MPDRYIGDNWNTGDMPTRVTDYRYCPNCNNTYQVQITAYSDIEYWTCPHCGAHMELKPDNGKYGGPRSVKLDKTVKRDPTKTASDFKRNDDREYLTKKKKRDLGNRRLIPGKLL